ncbi:hypothetical protein EVAR_18744_1 [Eumeta japonica]|uniref:Uncharacterized protein n=1 Tax=Eumeta variegata TaxID=151549 RepID=A0A4C1UMZ9_EUMVA|nr:hypothetical protein EVAR_18744_1 [Eumeta japonica]
MSPLHPAIPSGPHRLRLLHGCRRYKCAARPRRDMHEYVYCTTASPFARAWGSQPFTPQRALSHGPPPAARRALRRPS